MARIQSDNRQLGILGGSETRWYNSKVAETKTISPRAGSVVILHRIVVNSTTASAISIRDSGTGTIGTLKASVAENTYRYGVPCRGNLVIDNPGGSDLTIVFSND